MSNIIPTPPQAQLVEGMPVIDGQATSSVKTAVTTPEGLYAANLKPLLDHYYNALHMQILHSLANPFEAFSAGYVLLNGTLLKKENFPRWQKLVDYKLATELGDAIQLLDLTRLYIRPSLADVGSVQLESLPNIIGISGGYQQFEYLVDSMQERNAIGYEPSSIPQSYASGTQNAKNQLTIDASRCTPTYGRRDEVAPTSLLTYAYAYIGEYRGTTPLPTTYYLINSEGGYLDQNIILANDYGYNPLYMVNHAPPITQESERRTMHSAQAYRYVNGQWRVADR